MTIILPLRLKRHPSDCGYDSQSISLRLSSVRSRKSVTAVSDEVRRIALHARTAWRELATESGQPFIRVVRNLVACADSADTDAFALCLSASLDSGELLEDGPALRRVLKEMDRHTSWSVAFRHGLHRRDAKEIEAGLAHLRGVVQSPADTLESALQEGRFDDPDLLEAVTRATEPVLRKAFANALGNPQLQELLAHRAMRQPSPRALVVARKWITDHRLRRALRFLLTPPSGRGALLQRITPTDLWGLISTLDVDAVAAAVATSYRENGPRVLQTITAARPGFSGSSALELLETAFPEPPADVAETWFALASSECIDEPETWFALASSECIDEPLPGRREFLALVVRHDPHLCERLLSQHAARDVSQVALFMAQAVWRSPRDLADYIEAEPIVARRTLERLFQLLDDATWPSARSILLRQLVKCDAGLAASMLPQIALGDLDVLLTGLVVNDKPNLPRRVRRRLRAAVHQCVNGRSPHWHGKDMANSALLGRLAHLNVVQPAEYAVHRAALAEAERQRNVVAKATQRS